MAPNDATAKSFEAYDNEKNVHTSYPRKKPLIEYCTNEWQTDPKNAATGTILPHGNAREDSFLDCLERYAEACLSVVKAPKFRRLLFLAILLSSTSFMLWVKILSPWILEERAAWASLNIDIATAAGGIFGVNVRPHFPGMIQLADMDSMYLPEVSGDRRAKPRNKRRLIFVGDIHGCKKELTALLDKVHFNSETDHLVAAGDIVNKGPDSIGVVEMLRQNNASCVRGNHEDRLLLVADNLKSSPLRAKKGKSAEIDNLDEKSASRKDELEKRLAKQLTADQLAYLRACPLILRIGNFKSLGDLVVVHAGLVPGLSLDRQDPASVMNMRIVDLNTHVPSQRHEKKGCVPWFKLWNKYQQLLPAQQKLSGFLDKQKRKSTSTQTTVIYGHDSRKGLQIERYTKGLDTGCVNGGKLSALVVGNGGRQEIVQVQCSNYRK